MIISGVNLVMTVIGFAVSTMFIVFVCTRLICARIQLNATRRSYQVSSRPDYSLPERRLHGLDPRAIASFPMKSYSDASLSSEEAQCPVCLAEYHSEDTLRILPSCGHFFHVTCIDEWLRQRSTCPVCRISLREFASQNRMPTFNSAAGPRDGSVPQDTNPLHSPSGSPSRSPTAHDENRTEPFQENHQYAHVTDRGDEAGEIISVIIEKCPVTKDLGNKQLVESPSST